MFQRDRISQIEGRLVPDARTRSSDFALKYAISFEWISTAQLCLR
jgi:hypothetical protein